LQLATGKSRKSLEKMQKKLISSQPLAQPDNIYIHKIEKKVQDKSVVRYILVYGVFKTYQNAQDEAGKLPESIQQSKPWIRQLGVIQSIVSSKQKNKKT
jgi:septal ring-binding cell division protein DamX